MNIEKVEKITEDISSDIKEIHNGKEYELEIHREDLLYVAWQGGKVVGYIHARSTIAHILAIYVHKDYRGIGAELLGICIAGLKASGVAEVHAGVEPKNDKGLSFFLKQGFNKLSKGKSGFTNLTFKIC